MLYRIKLDIFRIISDYIPIQQLLDLDWNQIGLRPGKDWNQIVQSLPDIKQCQYCIKSKYGNLYEVAKFGNWKLVYHFIEKERRKKMHFYEMESENIPWFEGLVGASRGGHRDLVDFFISKGADNWDEGLEGAAHGGHRDLAYFFIEKGAKIWWISLLKKETRIRISDFITRVREPILNETQ